MFLNLVISYMRVLCFLHFPQPPNYKSTQKYASFSSFQDFYIWTLVKSIASVYIIMMIQQLFTVASRINSKYVPPSFLSFGFSIKH